MKARTIILILVVLAVLIGFVLLLPSLIMTFSPGTHRKEASQVYASSIMRSLFEAEQDFRRTAKKDNDHNKTGEYGELSDLAGIIKDTFPKDFKLIGNEAYSEKVRYRFNIILPETISQREKKYFIIAYPSRNADLRHFVLVMNESGSLWEIPESTFNQNFKQNAFEEINSLVTAAHRLYP